eukprot:5889335-Amphidinium_carterae.1
MQKCGVQPHESAFTTVIRACAKDKDPQAAEKYFHQMTTEHDLQPDVVAYAGVIEAYTQSTHTKAALNWLKHMLDAQITVHAVPFRLVTRACLRASPADLAGVEAVLRLMSQHRVPLSQEMFSELRSHAHFGE